MLEHQQVALIIPFYNEAQNIAEVICTIPEYVDVVILVNDGSTDDSHRVVTDTIRARHGRDVEVIVGILEDVLSGISDTKPKQKIGRPIFFIINHTYNKGKGAGVKSGYLLARSLWIDCIATMDGDGQMAPDELEAICRPIIEKKADYTKGNRLASPGGADAIPFVRLFGIYVLTFFTRLCSGYKDLQDAQSGYTAISLDMLGKMRIEDIYDRYGYVNDVIIRLSMVRAKIAEVPITPIYRDDRQSKMNILVVIPKISFMMIKLFFIKRMLFPVQRRKKKAV